MSHKLLLHKSKTFENSQISKPKNLSLDLVTSAAIVVTLNAVR